MKIETVFSKTMTTCEKERNSNLFISLHYGFVWFIASLTSSISFLVLYANLFTDNGLLGQPDQLKGDSDQVVFHAFVFLREFEEETSS